MPLVKVFLILLVALNVSTMLSAFMLARRMGMYFMAQVLLLALGMVAGVAALIVALTATPVLPSAFDTLHLLLIADLVLVLFGAASEFIQIFPILLKTMQGGPIHSAHLTNLIVTLGLLLGLTMYYPDVTALT
jgi:hypothetical protein